MQGWAYGRSLQYGEVMAVAPGPAGAVIAKAMALGLGAFTGAMASPPTRRVLDRYAPAPGRDPSISTQRKGWFHSQVTDRTEDGQRNQAIAAGPGDPRYAATGVMAGETALALALDGDRLQTAKGSLTPATALGNVLIQRLCAVGHTYQVTNLA